MAKDPAFLFYPGDYLRDTQCLSEKSQVAYDRIICEHMRNICISQRQLKFFTKRLSEDELDELMFLLTEVKGGYQISWVAESIEKRRHYNESRRRNRRKDLKNICESYNQHMENENENENEDINKEGSVRGDIKKEIKRFIKPTIEEIRSYCHERNNQVDPENFIDHYESNGWKIGGKAPMKDWKAAVRNWEKSEFNRNGKNIKSQTRSQQDDYGIFNPETDKPGARIVYIES